MKKPNLYLQTDLFWEEEEHGVVECRDIISKYFTVHELADDFVTSKISPTFFPKYLRASLAIARRLKRDFEFANCLSWVPVFRNEMVDPDSWFTDFGYLARRKDNYERFFARPCSVYKEFAGQVFTQDRFITEYNFCKQNKNLDDGLICMVSKNHPITREWRTIFINNQFVDGCEYLPQTEYSLPDHVKKYAIELSKNPYFLNKFDFVVDICEVCGKLHLLEINSFECSSFYACDLDKIYSTWANI